MSLSGVSTPDIVDLRAEGARAIEAFGEDPSDPGTDRVPAPVPGEGTLTYERHYGLREKPFSLSTDPRFLYRSGSRSPVLHDLAAAIRRREGLIVLTGDIGLGKTTLCRAVLSQLDRKTFATFVPDPFVTREDLLKTMLIDFGAMSVEDLVKGRLKGATRPDLSYPLYEFLQSLEPLDAFAVLVLDEVQNLSLPLLEEIRILSDLENAGRKLLQVVLVGQPEFDEHLKLPRMRQIKQRVSVHCELGPLAHDEVAGYVTHRLRIAGGGQEQVRLTDEALDLVRAASGGVPRVINLICDRALAQGHMARTSRIGPDLVSRGWPACACPSRSSSRLRSRRLTRQLPGAGRSGHGADRSSSGASCPCPGASRSSSGARTRARRHRDPAPPESRGRDPGAHRRVEGSLRGERRRPRIPRAGTGPVVVARIFRPWTSTSPSRKDRRGVPRELRRCRRLS